MIQIYYLFRDYLEQINNRGELQVEPIERKFRVILSRLSQLREIKIKRLRYRGDKYKFNHSDHTSSMKMSLLHFR